MTLLAALLAATAVAGCSSDDHPPSAPVTSRAPASPPPSAAAPSPDPASAPAGEAAEQFIRRWIELGNRMQATGDTAAYLAVAGPDCVTCRRFAASMERIYGAGGYVRGGEDSVIAIDAESPTQFVVTLDAEPSTFVRSGDGPEESLPGGRHRSRVFLADVEGGWIVGATETVG